MQSVAQSVKPLADMESPLLWEDVTQFPDPQPICPDRETMATPAMTMAATIIEAANLV
jgi:hypothetical protein